MKQYWYFRYFIKVPKGEEGKEKVGKGVESGSTVLRKPLSIIDWGETTERQYGRPPGFPRSFFHSDLVHLGNPRS